MTNIDRQLPQLRIYHGDQGHLLQPQPHCHGLEQDHIVSGGVFSSAVPVNLLIFEILLKTSYSFLDSSSIMFSPIELI